jgi:transcriptional regulator with XRE-family HTH domain
MNQENKLRKRRRELDLTQLELERRTGIHQTKISILEAGIRQPTPAERKRLARVLRSKISDLFPESTA